LHLQPTHTDIVKSKTQSKKPERLLERTHGFDFGRETTVNTQKLVIDDGGERQRVERIHNFVVHTQVILVLACKDKKYN
jgi:hypothetical protein